jgi:hypothetical protein
MLLDALYLTGKHFSIVSIDLDIATETHIYIVIQFDIAPENITN